MEDGGWPEQGGNRESQEVGGRGWRMEDGGWPEEPSANVPSSPSSILYPPSSPPPAPIRVGLRTGDSTATERARLVRKPPHILVTTPESLYLLLTAERGREALSAVDTIIIDEIHALVRDKRGSHLALSVERLEALVERPLQRIGLSATQRPIERTAVFLVGNSFEVGWRGWRMEDGGWPEHPRDERFSSPSSILHPPSSSPDAPQRPSSQHVAHPNRPPVEIIDVGHARELDLAIETPESELGAACMHEQWEEIYRRIVELIQSHRSTLVFVNTRRLAERVTHQLTELLGDDVVGAHHGSLAADIRLRTEQRLKNGELKAVVATASLELGLDIGYIDLVVQIGSPRSIATLLQRIGRSGHSLGL
ncbi:MAG: DEAD/DEAH box helicase, partial [Planctomycetes bacterium]|nr:DEAD/DEAH box helicase [Planctomycetota bacterium]